MKVYSPKISEELIPVLYRRAKSEHRPMTRVVNEILTDYLLVPFYCQSCNNQIMAEPESETAYCNKCESDVFLRTTSL